MTTIAPIRPPSGTKKEQAADGVSVGLGASSSVAASVDGAAKLAGSLAKDCAEIQ